LLLRALGAANSGLKQIDGNPFWYATAVAAQRRAAASQQPARN